MTRPVIYAGGGLVWRRGPQGTEFAVVHRPRHQDWSLPKGKLGAGEHPLLGAYREVVEETGARPVVGMRLPTARYQVPTRKGAADKIVAYWAMRAVDDAGAFLPTDEVDELRWMPVSRAREVLSYPRDAQVVAAFDAYPGDGVTATVVLLRHASAGERDAWEGPDITRPLDETGREQANVLTELLRLYRPDRLISATPLRCVQTLEPLASAFDIRMEPDGIYDEAAHERSPETAMDRLRELSGEAGTTVVCSQRQVIPDTVALLADTDGVPLPDVTTPKATGWVLSFAGATLVAVDKLSADPGLTR